MLLSRLLKIPARSGNPARTVVRVLGAEHAGYTSVRPLVFGPNALMMTATINQVAAI
jgi:hypothetical protein